MSRTSANPWRPEKKYRSRAAVMPWVKKIDQALYGLEVHICGSWRRQAPRIGDLDVVVVTEDGTLPALLPFLVADFITFDRGGPSLMNGSIELEDGPLNVDFYAAKPEQRGGFLWFLTGPKNLNIQMRATAMSQGRILNQYGLFAADETQIDMGTETHIAQLLGYEHALEPARRERWAEPRPAVTKAVTSSDGTKTYTVTIDGDKRSCTCPGFMYRRKCRHIKEV